MEYTKLDIKRNMNIMIITNIMVGFFVGFRDLTTTMQVLFRQVGGDNLLVLINQVTYYTLGVCLLVIGINTRKIELKYKIIFLDMMTYATYLVIAILLMFNMLTGVGLFMLMLINMICNRLLAVLTMDFRMKIMPKAHFKKFLGDITFIQTIATVVGMYASYIVIKMPYPNNFIIIMFVGFILGAIINYMTVFMVERTEKKETLQNKNLTFKNILEVSKEKSFILMNVGKTIYNMAHGLLIIYVMYAMRLGYSASSIVLFGLVLFCMRAIFSILVPKLKISCRQNMMIGHFCLVLSILVTFVTHNFYLGFAIWGIKDAFIEIGYYGYMNSFCDEKRHIYLTGQTFFNISFALAIPFATYILNAYGFAVISIVSIILATVSIVFIERMDENEDVEIHIFSHFKKEIHDSHI